VLKALRALPQNFIIYTGTLVSLSDLSATDHLRLRTAFLDNLNRWSKDNKATVKFHAVGEIGDNEKLHYHFILYADSPINHATVRKWWASACGGRCSTMHFIPESLNASVNYM
jgi:hypothetical protein